MAISYYKDDSCYSSPSSESNKLVVKALEEGRSSVELSIKKLEEELE